MSEKTVLVTGANKGIGLEIVKQLAKKGFTVFLTARDKERGMKAKAEAEAKDTGIVHFLWMDVSKAEDIERTVEKFTDKSGYLDVLINNAGILLDKSDIINMQIQDLIDTLQTNSIGPLMVIQHFLPLMKEGGRIINISSQLGALHSMGSDSPAYSISKTTLNAITRQFSAALSNRKISVNSMCPGWVRTDMGGANTFLSVDQGAETAVWLATEAPQNLTGKFIKEKNELAW